jgi:DNA processing protein
MSEIGAAERRARVILSRLGEPGDADMCRLVTEFSAEELLDRVRGAESSRSSALEGWRERLPRADYSALMKAAESVQARFVCPGDAEWPAALDYVAFDVSGSGDRRGGAPFGLWVRGSASLAALTGRSVAIVGSRASTGYGERVSGQLGFDCAARHITPVSGGAYGIDAAAHRGALARERPTVAVLAGGIDRPYPAGNAALLRKITETGLVVAEAPPGATARKSRFLVRNRLIAALTLGTVVVEAALRSGSLNTARWASDLGRPVMGIPGPVTSATSAGVNELLRQPGVLLVTDADEVIEHISAIGSELAPRKVGPAVFTDQLSVEARRVLEAVPVVAAASSAGIAQAAGVRHHDVATVLDELGDLGLVVRDGAGWRLAAREG